jgi:hypothetical protein
MKSKQGKPVAKEPTYQATEKEKAALSGQIKRLEAQTPAPRAKVVRDGDTTKVSIVHPNKLVALGLLAEAMGTADLDFVNGIFDQLVKVSGRVPNESELNFLLSVIKGIKPNDQVETMLAAQMAVVHVATMEFARHFRLIETLPQQDTAERTVNKLARTFTTQMEALKRYRTGGEQKVTVQHVSVSEGGQAIVGNVTQTHGKASAPKPAASTPRLTDAQQMPMPIIDGPERETSDLPRKKTHGERSSS